MLQASNGRQPDLPCLSSRAYSLLQAVQLTWDHLTRQRAQAGSAPGDKGVASQCEDRDPDGHKPHYVIRGDCAPSMSQALGREISRCGSLAMSAPPLVLFAGDKTRELLPERLRPVKRLDRIRSSSEARKLVAESTPASHARAHMRGQSGRPSSRRRVK